MHIPTLLLTLGLAASIHAQHPLPTGDNDWSESQSFVFLPDEVTEIFITMDESDLDSFLANPYTDVFVRSTVRIKNSMLDETHLDVGVRPRGNSQRGSKKFPWKLDFNEFISGRKFHGLEKMNLASESTDPSMSRETLAYQLFRSVGVAAGRTNHVWLTINDGTKVQGVYNHIEQVDEEFVQAWFGNKDGDLYKCRWKDVGANLTWVSPGTPATYAGLEDYEEEITDDYKRLADFVDFISNSSQATFEAEIADWLNVDSFLRAQGVDMYLGQWDGVWILPNNFYLYWDPSTSRFEYIPWDLDHSMGMDYWVFPYFFGTNWATRGFDGWGNNSPASVGGGNGPPLIDRLLDIPEYRLQLASYLQYYAKHAGHIAALGPRCDSLAAILSPFAFQGTFSGSSMENGYNPQDFAQSWESPGSYSAFSIPATWGVKPFLRARSAHVQSQYPDPNFLPRLVVNEVLPKNENGITDEVGELEDWVEIFNESNQTIDLGGFFLSDRYGDPHRWEFPAGTLIGGGDHLIVWCDGEVGDGPLHTNFKLDADGEGVYLFAPDQQGLDLLVSSLVFPTLDADESWSRMPDAGLNASQTHPTPNAPNQAGGFELFVEGHIPNAQVVHSLGGTPGQKVAFLYSLTSGGFMIGGGPHCSGTMLDLGDPVSIAIVLRANANGVASLQIPPNVAPTGVMMQALDLASCSISTLVQL